MIRLFAFVLLFAFQTTHAHEGLVELRKSFFKASSNESLRASFVEYAESLPSSSVVDAYLGAGYALLASEGMNPYTKLSRFSKGKELIENSVAKDPDNPELRFIRFMIQSKAPLFLDYRDNVEEDYNTIIQSRNNDLWKEHFHAFVKAFPEVVPD